MKNISLPIKYGLYITAGLIAYFLLLAAFGWHTNPFFSLFNGFITGFGIYEAIKHYKDEKGHTFSYTGGFTVGIVSGFIAAILFTIFFTFYATEINPNFLEQLLTVFANDYNVHIGLVSFVVAIMGFATTVVLTLTCMQVFKKSRNMLQNA
ncbi:hypothetical protein C7H62_0850 [Mesoflavibacter sp. HG96]|uniref:DUF4199 domain-containing protein n=1 Tax=Mesoflavibacter profundi TaxID=2708110 RepID=A0ABT4S1C2_9FLAO|nr:MULTISPECIES: DUF4199 domain-containing protein [Mesoflavibacter]MDA0177703.1 DUF4199 domain-containing protein [Mesoflavibacter profundi]QIJ88659.1 hypothetical protein C7H62_0850 [Mesoflavibacter sp. HG96]QIJ91387.1 hypothetical protein C7H56_0850 [Mesoflavibacter sp. HG37]